MPIGPKPAADEASRPGAIDYRLARLALVAQYRQGHVSRVEVCDAHPELVRAAREVGEPTEDLCPICEEADLVLVRYVFGPRMPPQGRCATSTAELARIARRKGSFTVYSVEACPACSFNHLRRSYPLQS